MKLFGRDLAREVVVVAEIGVNHEGDEQAARRMIRLAAAAGADAVKLQTYTPARYASSSDETRLARVSKFALDAAAHRRLASDAEKAGIPLFSTPLTEDVVPLLDELFPVIKIASGDLTFEPVIRAAARTGKPIILSTGIGSVPEIDQAVEWVRHEIGAAALRERLVPMHCVSAYPTPIAEANLRSIPFLAERYGTFIGYSNHVISRDICVAAVALGASVLEVHVTEKRIGRTFRDHLLSFEPAELASIVEAARDVRSSLGNYDKTPQASELPNREAIRKGVVAARDIARGTRLSPEDLMYARPATEHAAAELPRLIGSRVSEPLRAGELIRRTQIQ